LFRTPEFHAGEFELQDISSQAVGLICAPEPGQTVWDACAGEGGKTLHLSDPSSIASVLQLRSEDMLRFIGEQFATATFSPAIGNFFTFRL